VGERSRNRALWLGPLVAALGVVSYFTWFYRWPALRDFPWVNLALLAAGVVLSAAGLARAWPRAGARRILGVLGLAVSAGLGVLFVWFCFVSSAVLPGEELALAVGQPAPRVELPDQRGEPFDLAGGGRLVLVFYRGHW
jgi:hypothetical protein